MELQYDDVWAMLDIDGSLQGEVEAVISPHPEIFTWVKSELASFQSLAGCEDTEVVEQCDNRSRSQEGLHKGHYFYAATVRGSTCDRYPIKAIAEFTVFFTQQQYPPYGRTGLVFSTNDLLLYSLRVFRVMALLRKWAPSYSPVTNTVIGNAFNWLYKTKVLTTLPEVYADSSFDISELWTDLLAKAATDNYINPEQISLTLKGDVFLSENNCNPPSTLLPPSSDTGSTKGQSHGALAPNKQTEEDWEDGYYAPTVLAKHYGLQPDTARKRLDKYRESHIDGFQEVENRRRNEPKYLYQAKAVKGILAQ